MMGRELSAVAALDLFTQARKALSDRSPFEAEEGLCRVPTLPAALASYLTRTGLVPRKKHRKVQADGAAPPKEAATAAAAEGPRGIWAETEDYFRPVVLSDVEFLESAATSSCCFGIVRPGSGSAEVEVGEGTMVMEVANNSEVVSVSDEGEGESLPPSSRGWSIGLEWLVCCKHKLLLAAERPSKKRKLLGEGDGLITLVTVGVDEGASSNSILAAGICDVCCSSETGDGSNGLLQCSACSVVVHKKCYVVTEGTDKRWVCSWCARENFCIVDRPCVLCPKAGGALKPIGGDNTGDLLFAHLFCCQWTPEVYVENSKMMMPIMNIEEVKEARKKLVYYLCKLKNGVCIGCCHGTCRTPFHPICARGAKHRMEIWGKTGFDNVELRAFCLKHSVSEDNVQYQLSQNLVPVTVGGDSLDSKFLPGATSANEKHKMSLEGKNDDELLDTVVDNICGSNVSSACVVSQIADCQDKLSSYAAESGAKNCNGGLNSSDSHSIVLIVKKLLEQGKVSLHGVASDIGVSLNSLTEALKGEDASFPSEWIPKLMKWLHSAADTVTSLKRLNSQKFDVLSNYTWPLLYRRKETSGIKLLKDNGMVHIYSNEKLIQMNGGSEKVPCIIAGKSIFPVDDTVLNDMNVDPSAEQGLRSSPGNHCTNSEGATHLQNLVEKIDTYYSESIDCDSNDDSVPKVLKFSGRNRSTKYDQDQAASSSNIHSFIYKRLLQANKCSYLEKNSRTEGCNDKGEVIVSLSESRCKDGYIKCSTIPEMEDQLSEAKKMGILDSLPEDEVEGEIIYLQNKLIDSLMANNHHSEKLILRVVTNLSHELEYLRKQRWDTVLMNQFLSRVREANKLGRKEKRHKEAQAVLAVATAAVAASPRMSSLRKDTHDDITSSAEENLLKGNVGYGRIPSRSQLVPRSKDTFTRLTSEHVDNKERSCDICGRGETMLNCILVCGSCKVAVHLGCYQNLKDPSGPWYCEPCEEMIMQSKDSNSQATISHERTCGLCGWTSGAFRKSNDGQWVHAFCSEWILQMFRRGQSYPVEGMDSIVRDRDLCCLCQRKVGVCIKCSYGHCLTTFHPLCGKRASFYMKLMTGGGKPQHKAYCEKHSLEQKEEENQQYGTEVLGRLKQIRTLNSSHSIKHNSSRENALSYAVLRINDVFCCLYMRSLGAVSAGVEVELEKLRLLCERIVRREKVKKELLICSHDILSSKRDYISFSIFVHSRLPPPDVSAVSVTTSLKAHPEDNKPCSKGIQRSDDIAVDSTVSSKLCVLYPQKMEIDGRMHDSSVPQRQYRRKSDRISSSGKQLLHGLTSVPSKNAGEDDEKKSKVRKHIETLQKEMIMTSDQASIQNQRLPKGFAYVPIGCLSEEKQEPDG